MSNLFMLAYYDWDYMTTANDVGIERQPIPSVIWLICGVFHLTAHTLDGIDGKQARRTGSSTPLGKVALVCCLNHTHMRVDHTHISIGDNNTFCTIMYYIISMMLLPALLSKIDVRIARIHKIIIIVGQ